MQVRNNRKIILDYLNNNYWDFGNNILYKLCRDYPKHKRFDVIIAKIWLIGRAYAAAIERRKNAKENNDDFYVKEVAPRLADRKLDSKLSQLKGTIINRHTISDILRLHKYLSNMFQYLTDLNKRSLASKYLHFHKPTLFFIYDSRALKALRIFKKQNNISIEYTIEYKSEEFDKEYYKFFMQALSIKKYIENLLGNKITIREFDKILIGVADNFN